MTKNETESERPLCHRVCAEGDCNHCSHRGVHQHSLKRSPVNYSKLNKHSNDSKIKGALIADQFSWNQLLQSESLESVPLRSQIQLLNETQAFQIPTLEPSGFQFGTFNFQLQTVNALRLLEETDRFVTEKCPNSSAVAVTPRGNALDSTIRVSIRV